MITIDRLGDRNFADTAFDLLMKQRITNVLLICSKYDAFMLEQDGRIDEQIFNEYVSLNLRYPPMFRHVTTADEAFRMLQEEPIDLVITMLSIEGMDTFTLAKRVKAKYPGKPIVVLTPFSREVSLRLQREDLSAIDYVFAWLGNASLMLSIVKLIEDDLNLEFDVKEVGVQTILLVEDSVRYYSGYLPHLFKIVFTHSRDFMTEGLNEHQKMLRMRGRPKIMLAKNYEQAIALYRNYRENLLGVITDMSYPSNGKMEERAGLRLIEQIKVDDIYMPILLQSSDANNAMLAKRMKVGFLHKYSKTLSLELRDFVKKYFAFGDFIFVDPATGHEIFRAKDLKHLQDIIFQIPDNSLEYHIKRNHISKWLKARALFPIANLMRSFTPEDFADLDEVRRFIFDSMDSYRMNKGQGIISKYSTDHYDEYQVFSRMGEGSMGGKGRGLAFIDSFLKRHHLMNFYSDVEITIPRTLVLCTDIFDEFMEINHLYPVVQSEPADDAILMHFLKAFLPDGVQRELLAFLRVAVNPIAVRSSSLLEDSHYQPFAGIYSTYMIPNTRDNLQETLKMLLQAIKCVYASVYYGQSRDYMQATHNLIDEEKMAIVLQEVVGVAYNYRFYPHISGVVRSLNFYPLEPETPTDGIANVAIGLGKHVVDGRPSLRFSPSYPKKLIQLSNSEIALKETQRTFLALDLRSSSFVPSTDEGINLLELDVREAFNDGMPGYLASTYDQENHRIVDGYSGTGVPLISLSGVLKHGSFPLSDILKKLLEVGEKGMNNPVEIEFAINLNKQKERSVHFNVLQIRPIVQNREIVKVDLEKVAADDLILLSDSAIGNGIYNDVYDLVFVKPNEFDSAKTYDIAAVVGLINRQFTFDDKNYVLVGPGRWGSTDKWLGIPVKWSQISAARVIVEAGQANYRIDPSQGTHFFQNITSFRVGYFTINPHINEGFIDYRYLNSAEVMYDDTYVRHVHFRQPIQIVINGSTRKAAIAKPGINLIVE